MSIANRIALAVAFLGWVGLGFIWLIWVGWMPNLAPSDAYGPIPRFHWIEAGQTRPAPHILDTEYGISPGHACLSHADGAGCLRHNWLALLGTLQESDLAAPIGWRSYRLIEMPSCSRYLSVRLDIRPDDSGALTTAWLPPEAIGSHTQPTYVGPATRVTASVTRGQVDAIERAVARSGFADMIGDPSALWSQPRVFDGGTWVFEAYADGRYRYVARSSDQSNESQIRALAGAMVDLSRSKAPIPPIHPC
jgi:hypothetical protein